MTTDQIEPSSAIADTNDTLESTLLRLEVAIKKDKNEMQGPEETE